MLELVLIYGLLFVISHGCTTVAVAPQASLSGGAVCSHSNDGDGDVAGRLRQIPAADHAPHTLRDVTFGTIPQISHTYAYKTEGYAIANDYNVGLCESTCSAIFDANNGGWGSQGNLTIVDLGLLQS